VIAHQFVLLHAQSGAGKTSLLNARLIPLLEAERFEVLPVARVGDPLPVGVVPGEVANLFVLNCLMAWAGEEAVPAELAGVSPTEFLARGMAPVDEYGLPTHRILILDQFEELFTSHQERWPERNDFFRHLGEAADRDRLLRVVLVMRDDYIAQIDRYAVWIPDALRTRFRLERLDRAAALAAVTGPVLETDRSFAGGVAEQLVEDLLQIRYESETGESKQVTGEYVEPVQLQVVCQSLWRDLPPAVTEITQDHLHTFGDTDRALAKFYEDAVAAAAVDLVHVNDLREWCDRWLITSSETRGIVHRGREDTEGMPNEILRRLDAWHLIHLEQRAGALWYELTHDRFVGPILESNKKWRSYRHEQLIAVQELLRKADVIARERRRNITAEDYAECLACCAKAAAISESVGDSYHAQLAHMYMGDIYRRQGDLDKAAKAYQHIIEAPVNDTNLNIILYGIIAIGDILQDARQYRGAAECFTYYINLAPEDPLGYRRRATALWYDGEQTSAIRDFDRVIELDAETPDVFSGRGQCLADIGEYQRAIDDLQYALDLDKTNPDATLRAYTRSGLGLAYGGLGDFKRALRELGASIKSRPQNAWAYFNRGQVHAWMDRRDVAVADFRQSLVKSDPPLNPAKRKLALTHLHELTGQDHEFTGQSRW